MAILVWKLDAPAWSAIETYDTCIKRLQDPDLRKRLDSGKEVIGTSDVAYRSAGRNGQFDILDSRNFSMPEIAAREMSKIYDQRMAAKRSPGRAIYDSIKLASPGGKCPTCSHRQVMTLDHYLPKSSYPALAVNPANLVPSCTDCNRAKSAAVADTLHPYFDDIVNDRWLHAHIVETSPVAVRFSIVAPSKWSPPLAGRAIRHFEIFGLGALYAAQAARNISGIRARLIDLAERGTSLAVRQHLADEAASWKAIDLNSWEAAMYESLAKSHWFCTVGFKL